MDFALQEGKPLNAMLGILGSTKPETRKNAQNAVIPQSNCGSGCFLKTGRENEEKGVRLVPRKSVLPPRMVFQDGAPDIPTVLHGPCMGFMFDSLFVDGDGKRMGSV